MILYYCFAVLYISIVIKTNIISYFDLLFKIRSRQFFDIFNLFKVFVIICWNVHLYTNEHPIVDICVG